MQAFYDSHIHTYHSPDSQQPLPEICQKAIQKGLRGIAITDHADIEWPLSKPEIVAELIASIAETRELGREFKELEVFCGVELADPMDDPEHTENVLHLTNYDVVLGSIHFVSAPAWGNTFYSALPFDQMTEEQLRGFMDAYYRKVLKMAETADFDVLTHLTCPLRYINGKYGRTLDNRPYGTLIREILKTVIRRQKALEVNTSGIGSFYGHYMPDMEIVKTYYDLGGRLITLGSDAHTADRVGNAFTETAALLKEIGFPRYYYYRQRQPQPTDWNCFGCM